MTDDLTARITAALDAIEANPSDWPHLRSCQMALPVPEGFPWPTFSCTCGMPDAWQDLISAHREILALAERVNEQRYVSAEGEAKAWLMDEVLALVAKAHRIEVPE